MKILGILNITPDSFSDGGAFVDSEAALAHARQLMRDGANIIDIGAESTRPGAVIISPREEWKRLQPALDRLQDIPVSLDTRNHETAALALHHGNIKYLNDVSGFENPEMISLAVKSGIYIIVMHSLTVPADKNITIASPPVECLKTWMDGKFTQLIRAGIKPDKIIFDPGIGFGKTPAQSQELIERAGELAEIAHELGTKILYGHSRKSFLGGDIAARDLETARISAYLKRKSVDYVRVHDVKATFNTINGVRH